MKKIVVSVSVLFLLAASLVTPTTASPLGARTISSTSAGPSCAKCKKIVKKAKRCKKQGDSSAKCKRAIKQARKCKKILRSDKCKSSGGGSGGGGGGSGTRTERSAEAEYAAPAAGAGGGGVCSPGTFGCVSFALGAGETYVKIEITDAGGLAPYGSWGQDLDGDQLADNGGGFCGATDGFVQVEEGYEVTVFIWEGAGTTEAGDPCPGGATSGTVKGTFSNLPE
jgi:hypothetical protein